MCDVKQRDTECHFTDGSSTEDPYLSFVWRLLCARLSARSLRWQASAGLFAHVFFPFVCFKYTNNPAAPGEPLRKTDEICSNLILSHFVLGVCWRWLRQGSDRGLGVGCYLSSTGRQTKWRWYLFLLVHQSPSYLRLCLHPGLKTPDVCLEKRNHNRDPTRCGSMTPRLPPNMRKWENNTC